MKLEVNTSVPDNGLIIIPVVKNGGVYTSLVNAYAELLSKEHVKGLLKLSKGGELITSIDGLGSVCFICFDDKQNITHRSVIETYYQKASRLCKKDISCLVIPAIDSDEFAYLSQYQVEGYLLGTDSCEIYKTHTKKHQQPKRLIFSGYDTNLVDFDRIQKIVASVHHARQMTNSNADEINVDYFKKDVQAINSSHVSYEIFDFEKMSELGFGLFTAVAKATPEKAAMIVLKYQPLKNDNFDCTLVGKGITYDTGGLNLKPTGSIEDMKCDMSGAGTVLNAFKAVVNTNTQKNVCAVLCVSENAISSRSYKPGDVFKAYNSKTVEIGNTDAEGRLVLADALAYVSKHIKTSHIVDVATLTGAVMIALGDQAAGVMTRCDILADKLQEAAHNTCERLWRLPMYKEYHDQLKSDFADLSNIGGRKAASITAGCFLSEFVDHPSWAHMDIAEMAYMDRSHSFYPKNGTGYAVRLLTEFIARV
jgi:leucyl aminopeptidase